MKNIFHLFLCTILVLSSKAQNLEIKRDRTICLAATTTNDILKDLLTEYSYDCVEIQSDIQLQDTLIFLSIPLYFYVCKASFIGVSILESIDTILEFLKKIKENFNNEKILKETIMH